MATTTGEPRTDTREAVLYGVAGGLVGGAATNG